jgi:hypothetical protein
MNASRRERYDDPRRNERDFPHIVELRVPPVAGLQNLPEIAAWHRSRFLETKSGYGRTEEENREFVCYVRFCFKDPRDAEDFKAVFGGQSATPRHAQRGAFRA